MSLMDHLPIFPIILPFLAGVLMLLPPFEKGLQSKRILAMITYGLIFLSGLMLLCSSREGLLFYALGAWEPPYGIMLAVDPLACIMVLLTTFLAGCAHLFACGSHDKKGAFMHPLFMFQLLGINGAFLTGDIFNLFVFFEILLIASYGLVVHAGGVQKTKANIHYVFLNLIGSAMFLFALGTLYGTLGTLNMADMKVAAAGLDPQGAAIAKAGALLLIVVFGLKAALIPLHFWLPKTYSAVSTPIAALFAIMTKVGIYSLMRVHGWIFGEGAGPLENIATEWLWPMALITLAIGGVGVLAANNLRTLAANLVLISVGSLVVTVAAGTVEAMTAGIYYLIHSTLLSGALFLIAGLVVEQRGQAEDRFVSARKMPQNTAIGITFALSAIALIGMPPLSGFIGKMMILKSTLATEHATSVWVILLLAGLASLIALSRAGSSLFWRTKGEHESASLALKSQWIAVGLLLGSSMLLVVFAGSFTQLSHEAAQALYNGYSVQDVITQMKGSTP